MKPHYLFAMPVSEENQWTLGQIVSNLEPPNLTDLLEAKLRRASYTMQDYKNDRRRVLLDLAQKGAVIIPNLRLPPEYQQLRQHGVIFPSEEYTHLEQAHRDAWKRFTEARLEARRDQVVVLTPRNNLIPNYSKRKLSKRHNVVTTQRVRSIDDATKLAYESMIERLCQVKVGDVRVGIDKQGLSTRTYEALHLSDIARAQWMDENIPKRMRDDFIGDVSFYADTEAIWARGVKAIVRNVPSLHVPGKTQTVNLFNIPVVPRAYLMGLSIIVKPQAAAISYNFRAKETGCEKDPMWTIKYGREIVPIFGETERTGDEDWLDHHVIFAYRRMMRAARWLLEGERDPACMFVVLPMFPELSREAMEGFTKFYGQKMPESGRAVGGVVVMDQKGSHALSETLVDLDIALHNMIAVIGKSSFSKGSSLLPNGQRAKIVYAPENAKVYAAAGA